MQVNARHNNDHQLRSVLHAIATHRESEPAVLLVLQAALAFSGASGAGFRAFGDVPLQHVVGIVGDLPEIDDVQPLTEAAHLSLTNDSAILLYPVRSGDMLYGVLALYFDATAAPDGDLPNQIAGLVDALVVITAQAEMRAQSQRSRRFAQAVIDSIADAVLAFDADGRLIQANAAAESIFAGRVVLGRTLAEIVQPGDSETGAELLAYVSGDNPLGEWLYNEKIYIPHVQPIFGANNQPDGWVLSLHDHTQYKTHINNQNEFIRIVSHDIRSPLTFVQGFTSMLSSAGSLNDRQEHFVDKVLSGITTITQLVDNIQDAGRFDPETGFYVMSRAPADLGEIMRRIVKNYLIPAEKQELSLTVEVADDVPILNVDSNMLERAVVNLVDNAIKYTPNGGTIKAGVHCDADRVLLSVSDNGDGISPEDQKQLFKRHVRLSNKEHRRVKGSGLGLFIIKSVAQRHGGDAWVVSAEGEGSTFYISIPLSGENLLISGEN